MKFGQEFEKALAKEDFPNKWLESAIDYKHLKKCIKKIHRELEAIGLDAETLKSLSEWMSIPEAEQEVHPDHKDYYSAANPTLDPIVEEFAPQLSVLVDSQTGSPLDVTLAPETKESLKKLARHEMVTAGRRDHLGVPLPPPALDRRASDVSEDDETPRNLSVSSLGTISSLATSRHPSTAFPDARWVQVPLASAKDFFDMLEPKLQELEALRTAETGKLEEQILDLGDAVEDVVEPVREGFEARRSVNYRDLYFWREMFRLYMEHPIFYSNTESKKGALTFGEAKTRLQEYDEQLRSTGLLAKLKTPQAKKAAQQFLDVNLDILKIMHFQEMNAKAMRKILKKFDKQTHLEGQPFVDNLRIKYPALLTNNKHDNRSPSGFANSIARDLNAELASKVLSIVPQIDDWNCPVCHSMAWRPVNLGCCRSVFCIRCIIELQDEGVKNCPVCNQETVMKADGRNIDFEAMDFLEKYFPLEVKRRNHALEKASQIRDYGKNI